MFIFVLPTKELLEFHFGNFFKYLGNHKLTANQKKKHQNFCWILGYHSQV